MVHSAKNSRTSHSKPAWESFPARRPSRLTIDTFKRFCGAAEFLSYRKFLAESYVDINTRIRWCPGKGCGKAIASNGSDG